MKSKLIHILAEILHILRWFLTVTRNHAFPTTSHRRYLIAYNKYETEEMEKCYQHFKKYFSRAIFLEKNIQEYSIKQALQNDNLQKNLYLEFGVYKGITINILSKFVKKIYGFDSFEGLKDEWRGFQNQPKGTFDLKKKLPKLNKNANVVVGWVQDTLEPFLEKNSQPITFVHMDLDTYESTKFVLSKIKPRLARGSVILFDQLYNYPGWSVGEYKALIEVFNENQYRFLMFSKIGEQAAIEIL